MKIYLDDLREIPDSSWTLIRTVEECQELLIKGDVDTISMDNDLGWGYTEGRKLADWMEETGNWPNKECFAHSANPVARAYMQQIIDRRFK